MTGTNRSRRTEREDTRASRLRRRQESGKAFRLRYPGLDFVTEARTAGFYIAVVAVLAAVLAVLVTTGAVRPESDLRAILSFGLGLIAACALASSLTFLINLRHYILMVSLGAVLATAASIALDLGTLESLAKIVFGAATGLWLSLMLTSVGQVLLIAVLIIVVDFYSVFLGPTRKMVESGTEWVDHLTIGLPTLGVEAVSRLGISDIIFFSLFIGCALTFRLRRSLTALAMTASFVGTMAVGVSLNRGVPALPLLSIFFLLANADRLYRRYLKEPDEDAAGPDGAGPRP